MFIAYPACKALVRPSSEDKQCRAHAVPIYIGHVYYTPIGVGLALPCGRLRIYQILHAADKTFRSTSFLLCPVSHPLTLQRPGWKTMQKYIFFLKQ